MKKIININLGGRVIPIEDSAYEMLKDYIESLRRFFANEEGRDEIINDIETRIAELMSEKNRKGINPITDADMEEIITSMGRVEDFEAAEELNEPSATGTGSTQQENTRSYARPRRERGRLDRDSSDKIIGGVCSGIANYLDIDPAIIRILFAIISFGGGFGFLLYIILWIVLPPRDLEDYSGKRLYRNPDDKVIGGVAGGLAAYFGKRASTIRLIFAAPMLLNILFSILSWPIYDHGSLVPNVLFGSFTGTFIFVYIVLWIVLPEANSEYQKMEMRGEKVDVNRIRQNVQEGMGNVKDRMKSWGNEVKDTAQNLSNKAREFANTRGRDFAQEAGQAARRGGRGIGHVIGVLFKAFFLFIAGTIAFALFVALIGILIGGVAVWPVKDFLLDGFWQNTYAMGTLIFFIGVPVVGFIVWLLRRIMRVRSTHNYLGWIFGGLWALGWVCLFLFIASVTSDFRMSNYRKPGTEMGITQPANGKMIVKVTEPALEYSGTFPWINIDEEGFDITRDTLKISNIRIDEVLMSEDSNYHVEIKRYSRGRTLAAAEAKAASIVFNASYADSVLDLGSSISIDKNSKFRGQQVRVRIKVPAGKKIRFDGTIDKLHSFNVDINERRRGRHRDWESYEYGFDYETNVDYVMGADGILKDERGGKAPVNAGNDYRYNPTKDSVKPIDNSEKIRQEQQKIRESEQKIRELQQIKGTTMRRSSSSFAMGPSPVSSVTVWF